MNGRNPKPLLPPEALDLIDRLDSMSMEELKVAYDDFQETMRGADADELHKMAAEMTSVKEAAIAIWMDPKLGKENLRQFIMALEYTRRYEHSGFNPK